MMESQEVAAIVAVRPDVHRVAAGVRTAAVGQR